MTTAERLRGLSRNPRAIDDRLMDDAADELEALTKERDRYRTALVRILEYPVHSEPAGGAMAMQDFAFEALYHKPAALKGTK